MNNNIYINTKTLNEQIEALKKIDREMEKVFEEIKSKEKMLENDWISSTAEETFVDFNKIFSKFEEIKIANNKYIDFLTSAVNSSYSESDDIINQLVDTNIIINID